MKIASVIKFILIVRGKFMRKNKIHDLKSVSFICDELGRFVIEDKEMTMAINAASSDFSSLLNDIDGWCPHINGGCVNTGCPNAACNLQCGCPTF
jgi:hypothetical protein